MGLKAPTAVGMIDREGHGQTAEPEREIGPEIPKIAGPSVTVQLQLQGRVAFHHAAVGKAQRTGVALTRRPLVQLAPEHRQNQKRRQHADHADQQEIP